MEITWRRWKTCWCDRRNAIQRHSLVMLAMIILVSLFGMAQGQSRIQDSGVQSLQEHSDIIWTVLSYLVVVLFAASVGLVIWNIRDLKVSQREHQEDIEKQLGQLYTDVKNKENLLLETRRLLLELHAEHRVVMGQCKRRHGESEKNED